MNHERNPVEPSTPERGPLSKASLDERSRLIHELELAWVREELEAKRANHVTGRPHGLLGRVGFNTATG
jgi:hypothetical protein